MGYLLLILFLIGIDQASKWWIVANFDPYQSVMIWNFIKITYVQNTGVAFSLLDGAGYLSIIFVIILVIVAVILWKKPWAIRYHLPGALLIAGAVGNVIDRLTRGFVVDFINFTYWPVFNVADIFVCVGTALFAILLLTDKNAMSSKKAEKTDKPKKGKKS